MDYFKCDPDQEVIDERIGAHRKRRTTNPRALKNACDKFAEHQMLLDAGITDLQVLADIHGVHI